MVEAAHLDAQKVRCGSDALSPGTVGCVFTGGISTSYVAQDVSGECGANKVDKVAGAVGWRVYAERGFGRSMGGG